MRTVEEIYLDVILGNYEKNNFKLLEYDLGEIKNLIDEYVNEINILIDNLENANRYIDELKELQKCKQ